MNNNAVRTSKAGFFVTFLCLLFFLVLLAIPVIAQHMSRSTSTAQLADDTLIVLTAKGADMNKVCETLVAAGCRVLQVTQVTTGGYFLISVKPQAGKLVDAENKILTTADRNIKAVQRNYLDHFQQCPPDDPEFPGQWALTTQRFPQARCRANQTIVPRITFLDSGVYPVQLGDEMNQIQQYKFVVPVIGQQETPFDVGTHGTGVSGTAAAKTHNNTYIAGSASTALRPAITMCRVSNSPTSVNRQNVYNALTWCANNQALRGGPSPINVSINAAPPNTYNADPIIQTLAQTLRENGDLVVNGAGNDGLEDTSPELHVRRIAGTDQDNLRWANSNYGQFLGAAPVVALTYTDPWTVAYRTGTSFSTAYWSGAVALLISLAPRLTAPAADTIIYRTATITPQNYRIPNLEAAVRSLKFPLQAIAVPAPPPIPIRP